MSSVRYRIKEIVRLLMHLYFDILVYEGQEDTFFGRESLKWFNYPRFCARGPHSGYNRGKGKTCMC